MRAKGPRARSFLSVLVLGLFVPACSDGVFGPPSCDAEEHSLLLSVPAYPRQLGEATEPVGQSGAPGCGMSFNTPDHASAVESYYADQLRSKGWTIAPPETEHGEGSGSVTLNAHRNGSRYEVTAGEVSATRESGFPERYTEVAVWAYVNGSPPTR